LASKKEVGVNALLTQLACDIEIKSLRKEIAKIERGDFDHQYASNYAKSLTQLKMIVLEMGQLRVAISKYLAAIDQIRADVSEHEQE